MPIMKLAKVMLGLNLVLALVAFVVSFSASDMTKRPHTMQQDRDKDSNRRRFLETSIAGSFAAFGIVMSPSLSSAAYAADEEIVLPTKATVKAAFDLIRNELQSTDGGVSYMQARIDEKDFAGLMEFTKTYDLELRKLRMGKAKKLLQSKALKEQATTYANAVTFDLIGINRNSRKGQESVEGVNKYLEELREDVTKFLSLESTIMTED